MNVREKLEEAAKIINDKILDIYQKTERLGELMQADYDNTNASPADRLRLEKLQIRWSRLEGETEQMSQRILESMGRILTMTEEELEFQTNDPNMFMNIMLDEKALKPTRAHETDAGLDLYSCTDTVVKAHGDVFIDTGVHVQLPHGTAGVLMSRSGLNVRHGLTSTGLIDEGYTGSIGVKLYNHSNEDYHISRGDRISQLVVLPVLYVKPVITNSLDETERGSDGFGSTGRN